MKLPWRPASIKQIRKRLLEWFRASRKDYPWRRDRDPYRVWLAEIMLQQTRIAAVIPYYEKFLHKFPTVRALANAQPREVLRYWAGLGYYSRARNLHRAARHITARHAGEFPRDWDATLALPGIGVYTAAAVLSIAYDSPHSVVDGNVARVLARLLAVQGELRDTSRWASLQHAAHQLLATEAPGDWNQALMELGEIICIPKDPRCPECPVNRFCRARQLGLQDVIPAPRKRQQTVRQQLAAAVLVDPHHQTLLVRDQGRHDEVLFSRMWQFPAVQVRECAAAELAHHLKHDLKIDWPLCPNASVHDSSKHGFSELARTKHAVTFRDITLLPFLARVPRLPDIPRSRRLPLAHLSRLAVSSATHKIARAALAALNA